MRKKATLKNLLSGFLEQGLAMLLNFAVRTVFIYTLTKAYLGINGLVSSVLTVLNLANLGIEVAITYALYKPMGEGNREQAKSLMRLYRVAYRIVGAVILAAGLILVPFLHYFVKGSTDLVDLRFIFILYLLESVSSYWFFSYLSTLLNGDQKRYEISRVDSVVNLILAAVRLLLLWLLRNTPTQSFYVYTAMGVLSKLLRGFLLRFRVKKLYPWVFEGNALPLPAEERKSIFKNLAGMSANNVCRVLNDGIDSTIISAMIGLEVTGIYSNYLALKNYVLIFMRTFFNSLTAGVGNLCATESVEKQESFFQVLQFACFWMYGFCAICFVTLLDAFIAGVWLHDTSWLLSRWDVFLIAANFLIEGLAKAVITYRDACGLFWQTRWRYIFSSVFNALASILLVGPAGMGVTGALLGTTVSLIIMVSFDPVIVFREVFHKKAGEYYRRYFLDLLVVLATGVLVTMLCIPLAEYTIRNFILRLLVCLLIPNGLWVVVYRKDDRFIYLLSTARGIVKKKKAVS